MIWLVNHQMQIEQLTQDQNNQVPQYRNKWERTALTETFDRSSAEKAIGLVYSALSLSTPNIFFVPSPKAAVEVVTSQDFGNPLSEMINAQLVQEPSDKLSSCIHQSLLHDLNKRFCFLLNAKLCSIENANGGILYPVTKAKTTISYSDGQEFECLYDDTSGFNWRSKIVQMMYKKYES
jgi:hypothetical protein